MGVSLGQIASLWGSFPQVFYGVWGLLLAFIRWRSGAEFLAGPWAWLSLILYSLRWIEWSRLYTHGYELCT